MRVYDPPLAIPYPPEPTFPVFRADTRQRKDLYPSCAALPAKLVMIALLAPITILSCPENPVGLMSCFFASTRSRIRERLRIGYFLECFRSLDHAHVGHCAIELLETRS